MLLTAGFLFEFSRFIQIISWIVLPIAGIAASITVFLHYRKKNKLTTTAVDDANETLMSINPGSTGYKINDADYIYFDHSALVSEYEKRLAYNHARYAALRQDFISLEGKYSAILHPGSPFLLNKNDINMQYSDTPQQFLQAEEQSNENNSMIIESPEQLDGLNKANQLLEKENQSLKEQLMFLAANDDEKVAIINRWKNENSALQNKVTEQEYLKEIVEEKKTYIDFLQQQLEQRIRNQHQSEQQILETKAQFEQMRQAFEDSQISFQSLNNEVLQKQEETAILKASVLEKEDQLKEKKQLLIAKLDHIAYLENVLHETKQQNEILNAAVEDGRDLTVSLQEELVNEQSKINYLEQKLNSNKQMLRKLYRELSACVDLDAEESPVISLRPEYSSRKDEEIAVQ
jgi:chromosome segregation ATPase